MAEQRLRVIPKSAAALADKVGPKGEIDIDGTNNRIVLHDGVTPGGIPMKNDADYAALEAGLIQAAEAAAIPVAEAKAEAKATTVAQQIASTVSQQVGAVAGATAAVAPAEAKAVEVINATIGPAVGRAEAAALQAEQAATGAVGIDKLYPTKAEAEADSGLADGDYFYTTPLMAQFRKSSGLGIATGFSAAGAADISYTGQQLGDQLLELYGMLGGFQAYTGTDKAIFGALEDSDGNRFPIVYYDFAADVARVVNLAGAELPHQQFQVFNEAGGDSLWRYTGTDIVVFEAVQVDGVIYATRWRDLSSLKLFDPEVGGADEVGASSGLIFAAPEGLAAGFETRLVGSGLTIGGMSYGQSLSNGSSSNGIISTLERSRMQNRTFSVGTVTYKSGRNSGLFTPSAMTSSAKLFENRPVGSSRGETVCSGAANGAVHLAMLEDGILPSDFQIFASAAGKGSTSIQQLSKGYDPTGDGYTDNIFTNVIDHITQAFLIEQTNGGRNYNLDWGVWLQGEGNFSTSRAEYGSLLATLLEDINDVRVSVVGGDKPRTHWGVYQQCANINRGTRGPALALIDLALSRSDVHFVAPTFHLPSTDGTHLTPLGYLLWGHYAARMVKTLFVDQKRPQWIRPLEAVVDGSNVIVRFHVPVRPLVLDYDWLLPTTNAGFVVSSSAATSHGISRVQIGEEGTAVVLTMDSIGALGASPKVDWGLKLHSAQSPWQSQYRASHNLRDSDPRLVSILGQRHRMHNVAPAYELPITV